MRQARRARTSKSCAVLHNEEARLIKVGVALLYFFKRGEHKAGARSAFGQILELLDSRDEVHSKLYALKGSFSSLAMLFSSFL